MKVIFLDMDGVVNGFHHQRHWISTYKKEHKVNRLQALHAFYEEFDQMQEFVIPELAERISRIVKVTDCNIVWSSTWRIIEKYRNLNDAKEMFDRRGLPGDRLIDRTPSIFLGRRWEEIQKYLVEHSSLNIERFVIIDDDPGAELKSEIGKFFKTDFNIGITEPITNKIIEYLK